MKTLHTAWTAACCFTFPAVLGAAPDLAVDRVWVDPPAPAVGESLRLFASVRNAGNDAVPAGVPLRAAFYLDGAFVAAAASADGLPPGASAVLAADGRILAPGGAHVVHAVADDLHTVAESDEDNNTGEAAFEAGARGKSSGGAAAPRFAACQPVPNANFSTLSLNNTAPPNADVNIKLRGSQATTGTLNLVDINGPTDSNAPRLHAMFGPDRVPAITALYQVGKFGGISTGVEANPPHLVGFQVAAGEVIEAPDRPVSIGSGKVAMVIYVDENSLTLKFTREDTITGGYAVHILGICPDPALEAAYNQGNAAGRGNMPAVAGNQALGRAIGTEIWVSVRDQGQFMDPRSRKDWWQGAPSSSAPAATVTPQTPPAGTGAATGGTTTGGTTTGGTTTGGTTTGGLINTGGLTGIGGDPLLGSITGVPGLTGGITSVNGLSSLSSLSSSSSGTTGGTSTPLPIPPQYTTAGNNQRQNYVSGGPDDTSASSKSSGGGGGGCFASSAGGGVPWMAVAMGLFLGVSLRRRRHPRATA
jgi:hypothetical protein